MSGGSHAIEPGVPVRVSSLGDLVRLATVNAARMAVSPIYRFKFRGRTVYMIQTVYKDYYRQYGIPILYYYSREGEGENGNYILVKVGDGGENIEVSNGVKPGWLAIPIINLDGKPPYVPDDIV